MPVNVDFKYETDDIPPDLIIECETLSQQTGESHFIFDNLLSGVIKRSSITKEDKYHIGKESDFDGLPSRFSYYDTETKLVDRYQKYNLVVKFLTDLGFEPSESNFGPEYDQSYRIEISDQKLLTYLSPNLIVKIKLFDSNETGDFGFGKLIYKGFFNRFKIMDSISIPSIQKILRREIKIKMLLDQ